MRTLHRKLLRDCWNLRAQLAAIALVMACGVATFAMSLSTLTTLERSRDAYYARHRFADVFVRVERAPESLARRIADVPGVAAVETRVVAEARLEVPRFAEPVAARLISLPADGVARLNVPAVRAGRLPEPSRPAECAVFEAFARAHRLGPGERLVATVEGRTRRLDVVGVVLSPEFVYQIRPGEMVPDDRRYGVVWMGRDALESACDLHGAWNDASVALAAGASAAEVIDRIDALTARWGGLGAHDRSEQTSHRYVADEMTQLRTMAFLPPLLFLSVAAFLVQVVLARLVGTQREQIATLKAFGVPARDVNLHYLGFAGAVAFAGTALGVGAGAWFGAELTELYARYFRFPEFEFRLDAGAVVASVGWCAAACAAGAIGAVRRVARLHPAEALRPEGGAPAAPGRLSGRAARRLPTLALLVLRRLLGAPFRSAFACTGVALAAAVLVLGTFAEDAADDVIRRQFEIAQRHDALVTFTGPVSSSALRDVARPAGVRRAEPLRSVAVRIGRGPRSDRLAVTGLSGDATLLRPAGRDGRPVPVPAHGMLLSRKLAERLAARPGDDVRVELLEGRRGVVIVPVAGVADDDGGRTAWASVESVRRWLHEQDAVTGAALAIDADRRDAVRVALGELPGVAAVAARETTLREFRRLLAENLLRMRAIHTIFAAILAFGVVFNSARIALSEQSRDLATLRVLGFSRREVASVLLVEQAALTLLAIPPGLAFGRLLVEAVARGLETESQSFPPVVLPSTYGFAAAATLAAAVAAARAVRARAGRLDLIAVLKARE